MKGLATLLLLTYVLAGCGIREPELRGMKNLRVENPGLKETSVKLDLHYFNPNKSRLQFRSAMGMAWIEDSQIGPFTIDTSMTIGSRSEFYLPVRLKMDIQAFLANSKALLFKKEVLVRVEGRARIGKNGLFINYPFTYEAKHDLIKLLKELNQN
jgi:hypothetical protein